MFQNINETILSFDEYLINQFKLTALTQASIVNYDEVNYLKNCESEGMRQVLWRLQNLLPVVSVQIDAAQHVQLGVHPVQPSFDQVYRERMERNSSREIRDDETLIVQGDRVMKRMHSRWTEAWIQKKKRSDKVESFSVYDRTGE